MKKCADQSKKQRKSETAQL